MLPFVRGLQGRERHEPCLGCSVSSCMQQLLDPQASRDMPRRARRSSRRLSESICGKRLHPGFQMDDSSGCFTFSHVATSPYCLVANNRQSKIRHYYRSCLDWIDLTIVKRCLIFSNMMDVRWQLYAWADKICSLFPRKLGSNVSRGSTGGIGL